MNSRLDSGVRAAPLFNILVKEKSDSWRQIADMCIAAGSQQILAVDPDGQIDFPCLLVELERGLEEHSRSRVGHPAETDEIFVSNSTAHSVVTEIFIRDRKQRSRGWMSLLHLDLVASRECITKRGDVDGVAPRGDLSAFDLVILIERRLL